MTEEIFAVKLQQKAILDLVEEVKALRIQNGKKNQYLVFCHHSPVHQQKPQRVTAETRKKTERIQFLNK